MKILASLDALGIDLVKFFEQGASEMTARDELRSQIMSEMGCVLASATDEESYFYPLTDPTSQIVLGCEVPDTIRAKAKAWNDDIKAYFLYMLKAVSPDVASDKPVQADNFKMNTASTYELLLAAHMLDDDWAPYVPYGTVVTPYTFAVVLTQEQIDAAMEHPEQYALLDVAIK